MILNSTLSLTSETPLLKEELKWAKTVLQMLYDSNDSIEFREAVDWESTYRIQSTCWSSPSILSRETEHAQEVRARQEKE